MGCLQSSDTGASSVETTDGDTALTSQRKFAVKNLDDQNIVVGEGELEVTDTDLVLHSANTASIKWPLRFLRRYGFDENLFSFESGRRCPTGEGIYAFSTKHAKTIFTLVEHNVRIETAEPEPANGQPANGVSARGTTTDDVDASDNGAARLSQNGAKEQQPQLVKVKPQNMHYVKVAFDDDTSSKPAPAVSKQSTDYTEIMVLSDPASMPKPSLNYVKVDLGDSQGATASTPPAVQQPTSYTDVQLQPRKSTGGSGGGAERRPSAPLSPNPGEPTKYTGINFQAMKDIEMARRDA